MQKLSNGTELGAYRIVRLIGRGGMGEVYEAYETRLQRRVALKVIAPQKADEYGSVDLVRRFLQEARTLAQVNHPNIVTIYSIDKVGEIEFIAMEFVAGALFKDLYTLFALSADEAVPIFMGMLEGLRALHEKRILHRDLKPHNLMLRPNGQVKILDFGIAKRMGDKNSDNTTAGVVVGTLAYLPPEVLYGSPATERSDLWSLGAIFYEAMVGQPLVSAHSMKIKGIRAATDSDVVFPQEALAWIPEEMRRIVGRLCDRNPDLRYASASEAMEDLRRFQMKRAALPSTYPKALAKVVDNIQDIKRRVKEEKLVTSKSKRSLWLGLMGEPALANAGGPSEPAEPYVPSQAEVSQTGYSAEIKDSISSRNRAKSKNRSRVNGLMRLIPYVSTAVVLALIGVTWSQLAHRAAPVAPPKVETAPDLPSQFAKLLSPTERQNLWIEPGEFVHFTWSQPVGLGDYVLQVSWDKEFNSVVINEPVSATSYRTHVSLTEGEYFWRLSPLHNPSLPIVGPSRFTVALATPVELAQPASGQTVEIMPGTLASLDLSWTCKPNVQKYRVQLAGDEEFHSLVDERVLPGCSWPQVRIPAGTYYWRAGVEEPQLPKPVWSKLFKFTVKLLTPVKVIASTPPPMERAERIERPTKRVELSPPDLLKANSSLILSFARKAPGRTPASQMIENPPQLSWSKVRGASEYRLQLSSTADFSHLLVSSDVKDVRYIWKDAVPGKIFWRVRAQAESGAHSPYSDAGELSVQLPPPNLSSDFSISEDGVLEWHAVPMAMKYIVQSSVSRNMASMTERQVAQPQVRVQLSDTPLFIRVAAANSNGERVSEFSQPATLQLESAPAVVLKTPKEGAHVRVGASGKISVIFSWSAIDGAKGYEIEIAADPNFEKILKRASESGHVFVLREAKLKGAVYWHVRAILPNGPGNWSATSFFAVQ